MLETDMEDEPVDLDTFTTDGGDDVNEYDVAAT